MDGATKRILLMRGQSLELCSGFLEFDNFASEFTRRKIRALFHFYIRNLAAKNDFLKELLQKFARFFKEPSFVCAFGYFKP